MSKRNGIGCAARAAARAILGLALAGLALAGCTRSWNEREREEIRAAVDRINAAAAASKSAAATAAAQATPPPPAAPVKQGEVELTLLDALRLALAGSQEVQIAGFTPLLAETDLVKSRAAYDPSVFASNTFGRNKRPIESRLEGNVAADAFLIDDTWAAKAGLKDRLPTGGQLSVYHDMSYLDTNNASTVPTPQYLTHVTAELSQPLLKGFGDPAGQAAIRIASLAAGITLEDFRQKVMEVASRVTAAYWQLAFDREMSRVSRDSLKMAEDVLQNEQLRAAQALSSQLNVARASSAVSTRRTDVLRSENRARNSEDQLKRLLNSPEAPVESEVRVVPIEAPRFFLIDVDRTASMTRALARRPELERARGTLAVNRVRVDASDRDRLPKLDALLRYTVSGMETDLGASYETMHLADPVTWVGGLEFELPIGNRNAEAEYQRRRIEYEQTLLEADRAADQVLMEVSLAVRSVLQGRDEVEHTLQARDAAKQVVDLEPVRMELGPMDTRNNDEMLRAQDTWAAAERDHLMALLNFNLALTELARAQGTLIEDNGIEVVWPEADRPGRLMPVGISTPRRIDRAPPAPVPDRPAAPKAPAAPAPAAPKAPDAPDAPAKVETPPPPAPQAPAAPAPAAPAEAVAPPPPAPAPAAPKKAATPRVKAPRDRSGIDEYNGP